MSDNSGGRLLTVGYEGLTVPRLLDLLAREETHVLVDVREVPLSRKPGFSKTALAKAAVESGIKYLHLKELGSPRPLRTALKQTGDVRHFFAAYRRHLANQGATIESLACDAAGHTICLLCFEKDHSKCHRSVVAQELARLTCRQVENL